MRPTEAGIGLIKIGNDQTERKKPMPTGRELARKVSKLRPELRVVYMTGYSRNAVTHHGQLDPNLEVLQKPITQSDLAMRIREALDTRTRSTSA